MNVIKTNENHQWINSTTNAFETICTMKDTPTKTTTSETLKANQQQPQTITHNPQPFKANRNKQRKAETSKHDQNNKTKPRTIDASKNQKKRKRGKHTQKHSNTFE